jgi:predicted ribosome quality control (RQC) complex YloA/Tae2 family protein
MLPAHNCTVRSVYFRELSEELASLKTSGQQQLADAQQQVQLLEQQWRKQLDVAHASAQEAQQQLERRLQQQDWQLEQQSKRAEESEQQCRSLQQQVLQLQQSLREAQLASEVGGVFDGTKASMSGNSSSSPAN